ncbi:hypothetical protein C2L93_05115 [Coxiella burnetii]|nr:hypothetical protein C2L93_05115 [Coxiella burnetii]
MLAHYDAVFKGWVHFIGLLSYRAREGARKPTLSIAPFCLRREMALSLSLKIKFSVQKQYSYFLGDLFLWKVEK